MRTVEEIKTEYILELDKAAETKKEAKARKLRAELINALTRSISTYRIEEICNAEKEGRCVVLQSCDGCKHNGLYEDKARHGFDCPCLFCPRRPPNYTDKYEPIEKTLKKRGWNDE